MSVAVASDGVGFTPLSLNDSVGIVPKDVAGDATPLALSSASVVDNGSQKADGKYDGDSVFTLLQLKNDLERYHQDNERMRLEYIFQY